MRLARAAVLAALVLTAVSAPAEARKVANPSPPNWVTSITGGEVYMNTNAPFALGSIDPDPTLTGTIAGNGAISIPTSGVNFPPLVSEEEVDGLGTKLTARFQPAGNIPWTGTIDPGTGVVKLTMRFKVKLEGGSFLTSLGGSCYVGSDSNPVVTTVSSDRTIEGFAGVAYNETTGTARLVDDQFQVPAASNCGIPTDTLNSSYHLPSAAGLNRIWADVVLARSGNANEHPQPGVRAAFTASSGTPAAHPTSFDASASTAGAGLRATNPYEWDFDNNGSYELATSSATAQHTFLSPGTYPVRLRVTDVDGDAAILTKNVVVGPGADLGVAVAATGGFLRPDSAGQYAITVSNTGTPAVANGAPITVNHTLPAGVTASSAAGTGWSCAINASLVQCTRTAANAIAPGASAPPILVDVQSPSTTASTLSSTTTVATAGDANALNNTSTFAAPVRWADLTVDKAHAGDFTANGVETYTLDVTNVGTADTIGTTKVIDTLPVGLTYDSASGSGWSCAAVSQVVTCENSGTIAAAGGAAPQLSLRARVSPDAAEAVVNTARVEGVADMTSANDNDSDPTTVVRVPDLALTKTHSPAAFRVGGTGTLTYQVDNQSLLAADGPITIQDTLPAGLTMTSASGTGWICGIIGQDLECTRGDGLAAGASADPVTVSVDVTAAAYPGVDSTATLTNAADGYAPNNTATDAITIRRVDLRVLLTPTGGFSVGRPGVYRINVENLGAADTVGPVTVTTDLAAGLEFTSATGGGWTCSAADEAGHDRVTCTRSGVPGGAAVAPITITTAVGDDAVPSVTTTATVATTDDPVSENDTASNTNAVVAVDIAVESQHAGRFLVGREDTYLLKVRNVGALPTVAGEPITLVDTLPEGVTIDASGIETDPGWEPCEVDGRTVSCTYAPADAASSALAVGASTTVELPVTPTADAAAEGDNVVEVATLKDASTEASANNRDTDTTAFDRVDVGIAAVASGPFRALTVGQYDVTVDNDGTAATGAPTTVALELPAGTSFRGAGSGGTGWSCTNVARAVTCVRGASLAAGATAPALAVRFNVPGPQDVAATWTQQIAVSTPSQVAALATDDTATVNGVLHRTDFRISKSHTGLVRANGRGAYRLVVSNLGDIASRGTVHVSDELPSGLVPTEASGTGWSCAISGQDVDCSSSAPVAADTEAAPLTVAFRATPDAGGTRNSTARVSHPEDVDASNDTDDDPTLVSGGPDLALTRSAPGAWRAGDTATLRYTVKNAGGEETGGVPSATVLDTLPDGVTLAGTSSSDSSWDCTTDEDELRCERGTPFAPNAVSSVDVRVDLATDVDPSLAFAAVVRTTPAAADTNPDNDDAAATVPVKHVDLTPEASVSGALKGGGSATYQVVVKNEGDATTAEPTVVEFPLPSGVAFSEAPTYGAGWSCALVPGNLVRCETEEPIVGSGQTDALSVGVVFAGDKSGAVKATFEAISPIDADRENDVVEVASTIDATPQPPKQTLPDQSSSAASTSVPTPAGASPFRARLLRGAIKIGNAPVLNLAENQLTLDGSIAGGAVTIPAGGIKFEPVTVQLEQPGIGTLNAKILISATDTVTGTYAAGGAASLKVPLRAKLEIALTNGVPILGPASQCYIGPIGTSLAGSADAGGAMNLKDATAEVPAAPDACGPLAGQVNSALGLPAGPGQNSLDLTFAVGSIASAASQSPAAPKPATAAPLKAGKATLSKLKGGLLRFTKNVASVTVKCAKGAGPCKGKAELKMRVATRTKGKLRTRTLVIGSKSYSVAAGKSAVVKITLNKTGRKYARNGRKVSLAITPSGAKKPQQTLSAKVRR